MLRAKNGKSVVGAISGKWAGVRAKNIEGLKIGGVKNGKGMAEGLIMGKGASD